MSSRLHPIAREIAVLSRAGYPLLWVVTHEEERALGLIEAAAVAGKRRYATWSICQGFGADDQREAEPKLALEMVARSNEPTLFVLLDFHRYLDDSETLRLLKECLPRCAKRRQSILIVAPVAQIPTDVEKDTAIVDLPLPTADELKEVLHEVAESERVEIDLAIEARAVQSALGLTSNQAGRVFRRVMVLRRGLSEDDLGMIVDEKKSILRNTDALEFHELDESLHNVGGLGEMKRWLGARTAAFGDRAREFGLPAPKGLLLLGVQGCGKSLSAKAVAHLWKFPLLRLDMGALFSTGTRAPEGAIRNAIKVAESLAPVVMWVDEIEKGFAGGGESEASTRVFGSFITWLSEKKAHVFVVATANDVTALPPELMRRGRFDEVFFVDLPNQHERLEILRIHLNKRDRDPKRFPGLEGLAKNAEFFSGAELEQVVVAALYLAFSDKRDLIEDDLRHAIQHTVPLYKTYEEKIKALRDWARRRARPATLDTSVLDMFEVGP